MRVLVVEDSEPQARLIGGVLERASGLDFEVLHAHALAAALDRLGRDGGADVVLLDLDLPDSRGLDTFRALNAAFPYVPVVVFTGCGDEGVAEQAVQHGAQDYLLKGTTTPAELLRAVRYSVERHRALAAARESEERFRLLVEGVKDYAIILVDPAGRVVSWNAGAERLFGHAAPEIEGRHFAALGCGREDEGADLLRRAVESGRLQCEQWMTRRDGSQFWAEVSLTPLADRRGEVRGFAHITRDVTDRKRSADELLAYQDRLRRLAAQLNRNEDAERRRLASLLHDGISQALAAAQIKLDTIPEESAARCGDALHGVRELIGEAIDLTRRMTFDLSPPVLYQLGLPAALVALTEQVRRRHNIDAEVHCRGTWTPMMKADTRGLLYQAIRELVNNVIKHARATRLQILLFRRNPPPDNSAPGSVRVRVIDDGVGFDPRAAAALTREVPGTSATGFGLFNLRERLAHAQGWIVVRAAPGKGTEVEFEVAMELAESEPAHAGTSD